jgi:hypothetical protein
VGQGAVLGKRGVYSWHPVLAPKPGDTNRVSGLAAEGNVWGFYYVAECCAYGVGNLEDSLERGEAAVILETLSI